MRAVWSFWSKPFHEWKGRIWQTPSHHLMAWGLSLRLARRHFAETALVTDTAGKELLVDRLGLSFDHVSCELDCLRHADAGWWALGKLVAYSLQQKPFIHLDTDVFLWKPLPATLLSAPVIAQCPERHFVANQWCSPTQIEALFARFGLTLPVEWEWSRASDATCGSPRMRPRQSGNTTDRRVSYPPAPAAAPSSAGWRRGTCWRRDSG